MNERAFAGKRVVVTGAGRDFGRTLALLFAAEGADVIVSARTQEAAQATVDAVRRRGGQGHAYACDLSDAASIAGFAASLASEAAPIDVLILNAARWLEGDSLAEASDEEIMDTVSSGLTGAMLLTRHLLPALAQAPAADILAMVSVCGEPGYLASNAHPAFYAAKHGMAGFCDVLGARLAPQGIRVTGLFPPDFENIDPLAPEWEATRPDGGLLAAPAIWNAVRFALTQPRGGGVRRIHFSGPTRAELGL